MTVCAVAVLLTACSKEEPAADATGTVAVTFKVEGDFVFQDMTRSLNADGKALTDLWVLDYVDGTLKQQLHQTSEDENFGTPTMDLAVGSHHVYFVASRGKNPTLDTSAHTIVWGTASDTFYKDYAVNVVPTSTATSHSVTLDRAVTRFKVSIADPLPEDLATVDITPATWYLGIDYLTGEHAGAVTAQTITQVIPDGYAGRTDVSISIFSFSGAADWQTNISIVGKTASGGVLGSVSLTDVPFRRNRSTDFSGPLFSANGSMTITLNDAWDDPYEGTW